MGPYVFVATEYKKLRIVEQNMISFCFVASLISYDWNVLICSRFIFIVSAVYGVDSGNFSHAP